ncbi:rrna-processing protein efg1 [Moniliophthora roreri MCA 2997]|uniref:rRNA-processing protein EFG1 n=1 Tax=Moniliophthora roreri (strain MCA 2997) TaxID=1381753 RepID=V2X1Y9_MONRO|nr:rrna-processing protein efg1 [Moniliophthora roreri MCA 2997]
MGPVRTQKHSKSHGQHSSYPQTNTKAKRKHTETDLNALPGVQKIKAAIRQTRRLLAKDKLAADVRVTTERKLKSLEADLAKAEESRKERAMATRYHAIKFFERKKITRKINQANKKLSEADGSSSSKEKLEEELFSLRVDLNYILHYPKAKKYISLFPPEIRNGQTFASAVTSSSETDAERAEIRRWIREQMEKGVLSKEPELEHASEGRVPKTKIGPWDKKKSGSKEMEVEEQFGSDKDDFFEDDGDGDDDS